MKVTIPGEPVAQGRPRMAVIGGRARAYDPKTSRDWKGMARGFMVEAVGSTKILHPEGPLMVRVAAFHTCPKSRHRKREPAPRVYRDKKPDVENIAKAVMDAGTGIFYTDDAQVAVLQVAQYTCAQDEQPRVEVEVVQL